VTIRSGMGTEMQYRELNAGSNHKNRGKIYKGPESARVRLMHGDSHFCVIRHHEFNGAICFLI
jgi:hypothetical protein